MGNNTLAVDLDGTLAEWNGWNGGNIGNIIQTTKDSVLRELNKGRKVVIFTARASTEGQEDLIQQWLVDNGLPVLGVTNVKSLDISEIWDDKAVAEYCIPKENRQEELINEDIIIEVALSDTRIKKSKSNLKSFIEFKENEDDDKEKEYVMYISKNDDRSRPAHAKLHGKYMLKGSKVHASMTPPCDGNCRCKLKTVKILPKGATVMNKVNDNYYHQKDKAKDKKALNDKAGKNVIAFADKNAEKRLEWEKKDAENKLKSNEKKIDLIDKAIKVFQDNKIAKSEINDGFVILQNDLTYSYKVENNELTQEFYDKKTRYKGLEKEDNPQPIDYNNVFVKIRSEIIKQNADIEVYISKKGNEISKLPEDVKKVKYRSFFDFDNQKEIRKQIKQEKEKLVKTGKTGKTGKIDKAIEDANNKIASIKKLESNQLDSITETNINTALKTYETAISDLETIISNISIDDFSEAMTLVKTEQDKQNIGVLQQYIEQKIKNLKASQTKRVERLKNQYSRKIQVYQDALINVYAKKDEDNATAKGKSEAGAELKTLKTDTEIFKDDKGNLKEKIKAYGKLSQEKQKLVKTATGFNIDVSIEKFLQENKIKSDDTDYDKLSSLLKSDHEKGFVEVIKARQGKGVDFDEKDIDKRNEKNKNEIRVNRIMNRLKELDNPSSEKEKSEKEELEKELDDLGGVNNNLEFYIKNINKKNKESADAKAEDITSTEKSDKATLAIAKLKEKASKATSQNAKDYINKRIKKIEDTGSAGGTINGKSADDVVNKEKTKKYSFVFQNIKKEFRQNAMSLVSLEQLKNEDFKKKNSHWYIGGKEKEDITKKDETTLIEANAERYLDNLIKGFLADSQVASKNQESLLKQINDSLNLKGKKIVEILQKKNKEGKKDGVAILNEKVRTVTNKIIENNTSGVNRAINPKKELEIFVNQNITNANKQNVLSDFDSIKKFKTWFKWKYEMLKSPLEKENFIKAYFINYEFGLNITK